MMRAPAAWLLATFLLAPAIALPQVDVTYTLGASSGTVQALLGVNAGPLHWATKTTTQDVAAGFRLIGVASVRTHDFPGALDMKVMYPDRTRDPSLQTSYNFTTGGAYSDYSSDTAATTIRDNGFGMYLRIWDSAGGVIAPAASERANWVRAAVEVVRHYQEGKWNGYTNLVSHVEIGNEPDSSFFWPSTYTKEEFYALYCDTALALRAAFPTLKIGGPGVTKSGYQAGTGQTWTRGFLNYVQATGAPLDFLSWHTYSNSPDDFTTGANFYQSELNSRGYTNTEQHVTEYHTFITASNDPTIDAGNIDTRTMGKGAALLTANWISLQQAGIKQAYLYRANDPGATDHSRYGLFATDGSARRTALAFSLWAEFAGYTGRIDPSASATVSGIKALAAERADGRIAVLIANTSTASKRWTLAFSGTRNLSDYTLTLKTVDDSHSSVNITSPASSSLDLTANSVQLLTLLPNSNTLNLVSGWNLLGNGTMTPITVASSFGDAGKVNSVWKWVAASPANWAYYAPGQSDAGQAYASSKGYSLLTTINSGEGFWVNAKTNFSVTLAGAAKTTLAYKDGSGSGGANPLAHGWNLIAVGDGSSPRAFANGIAAVAPAVTSVAVNSVTSLWAWYADPAGAASGWYFYAPGLDNSATLSSYAAGNGYLDFTSSGKSLSPSTGFWVNHP